MDLVDRMLEYDRWATTQLLGVCQNLTDAQLDQEFDIGIRTLRDTLDHLIFNMGVWTWSMAGQPMDGPDLREERNDRSMPALIERFERYHARYAALARKLRDENKLDETYVDHFGGTPTYGGIVFHVIVHHPEHRSEMLHILRRLGVEKLPEIDPALWDQTVRVAISRIREERDRWRSLAAEVGEERMEEPGPMGEWTFKDMAAHLYGWGERTIALIEAGPGGNPPTPWPAELDDDDDINAWIYEQHRDRPLRDVLNDMEQYYDRLIKAIEATPEGDLTSPGRFDWLGDKQLFEADFSGHFYDDHVEPVRVWLASG